MHQTRLSTRTKSLNERVLNNQKVGEKTVRARVVKIILGVRTNFCLIMVRLKQLL